MKLDYKILWLDDKIDVIIEGLYDNEIRTHLEEQGFNPVVETVKNEKEFFQKLDDSYDLILTDYHLNESSGVARDGDVIIKEVREASNFTEIMFYTAQGEIVDTVKMDRITFVDTRKSTIRDHNEAVIDRAKKLIDLTIKKFQHIVVMRGMIMHETSGLDIKMAKIVNDYLESSKNQESVQDILIPIFKEIQRNAKEKYDKSISNKPKKILTDNVLFNASQKVFALGEILKKINQPDFSKDYGKEIIWHRNQFAHAELFKDRDTGKEYFKIKVDGKDDELILDEAKCKEIRQSIIKHKKNIDGLITLLS